MSSKKTHKKLTEEALYAVDSVFLDQSVVYETTKRSLQTIRDKVDSLIQTCEARMK